ncbi:DUF1349 domain-containing protein [Paenibacillus sp. N3.4]|uniref:DUF1349 domain-containing protein n=1 Tax=Paenibacillus sp. N3.4 TaxID=2603222 RepID=UPI0011CA7432|nr:DUF1349 domain-containing protein [Paenibacillus sp. N3.4]TXK74155.1 DUF1349 domain-containing protein [Paenibacillus sp. N3.4]
MERVDSLRKYVSWFSAFFLSVVLLTLSVPLTAYAAPTLASVNVTSSKSTLNLDGTAVLTVSGLMSDGTAANLSGASKTFTSSDTDLATVDNSGNVRAETKKAGNVTLTASVTLSGTTKSNTVPITVKMAPDVPFTYNYGQTLTLKFTMEKDKKVYLTFEKALEVIKKIDNLTRGIPKIIYLSGWQFTGKDTGFPAWSVVDDHLKRPGDATATDSLRWLMSEASKYNTTVSLHINMLDAAPPTLSDGSDRPLWQTYLDNDIIARNADGTIRSYVWGNALSYTREWTTQVPGTSKNYTQKRIDDLIAMLPIAQAGTIHIDAFHQYLPGTFTDGNDISPWHRDHNGITKQVEADTQKKIIRYWRSKGIDVTAEFDSNYRINPLIGLQPMAWHYGMNREMEIPASLYVGGDGGNPRFGETMLGQDIVASDPTNLSGFLEQFSTKTLPWYYLNRLNRISDNGSTVTFSNNVLSSNPVSITQNGNTLRTNNDVFIPALWRSSKEIIAWSTNGYTNTAWTLPSDWSGVASVDIFNIGLNGLTFKQTLPITNSKVTLSLTAKEGVSILPHGSSVLPSGWVAADVGTVGAQGSTSYSSGKYSLQGSGADVSGTVDEFHYAYKQVSGDFTLTARLANPSSPAAYSKFGIMARNTLAANSEHMTAYWSPNNGQNRVKSSSRLTAGAASASIDFAGGTPPLYVRVNRTGNTFTTYYSADGTTFTQMNQKTITMNSSIYVGMFVCSNLDGTLANADFDNVVIN